MARTYGQYCGLARAADLVGERWALLVVRDLITRPRRFSELRAGLPGIPPTVLTARLRELESAGVIQRVPAPLPASGLHYTLTPYGDDLGALVVALGRWGAQRMGPARAGEVVTDGSFAAALLSGITDRRPGRDLVVEVRGPGGSAHLAFRSAGAIVSPGPAESPDVVLEGPALRELLAHRTTVRRAVAHGTLVVTGRPTLAQEAIDALDVPLDQGFDLGALQS